MLSRPVLVRLGTTCLNIELLSGSKRRMLERPCDEPLQRSLLRLKKALGHDAELVDAEGASISLSTPARNAWQAASSLRVGDESHPVLFDPPEVTDLELPFIPQLGLPMRPILRTRCCLPSDVRFAWERCLTSAAEWEPCGTASVYVPTARVSPSFRTPPRPILPRLHHVFKPVTPRVSNHVTSLPVHSLSITS